MNRQQVLKENKIYCEKSRNVANPNINNQLKMIVRYFY